MHSARAIPNRTFAIRAMANPVFASRTPCSAAYPLILLLHIALNLTREMATISLVQNSQLCLSRCRRILTHWHEHCQAISSHETANLVGAFKPGNNLHLLVLNLRSLRVHRIRLEQSETWTGSRSRLHCAREIQF